ncbi:bifunctional peptidase and (3S)-lysyl hydroxylase Jmjd7-like [Glandiceps talaboti]
MAKHVWNRIVVVLFTTLTSASNMDAVHGPSTNGVDKMSEDLVTAPGHLKPLGSHRPPVGTVDILDHVPHPFTFFRDYVQPGKPVLFRGAAKNMRAFHLWNDEYLRDRYGKLEVEVEEGKKENRSLSLFHMTLARFLDIYNMSDVYMVESMQDQMKEDFMLLKCMLCGGFTDALLDAVIWFSSGGTKSVLHFDALDNINCLMDGEKELIMMDRKESDHIDIDNPSGNFCEVDVDKVDMTKYPGLQDVPWYSAKMKPSDCMFIPYKWFHQVTSSGRNLAVNIWFAHLWKFSQDNCQDVELPAFGSLSDLTFGNSNEQFRGEMFDYFYGVGKEEITEADLLEYIRLGDGDEEEARQAMEEVDVNKDGIISQQELLDYPIEKFALLFPSLTKDLGYPERPEDDFSDHDEL